jgi:HD superfamily phosphodiesterase
MTAQRPTIARIAIPDGALAREATEFVRDAGTQLLFDHSRRVFLWASLRAEQLSLRYDAELLYVEAMFHDVGLLDGHRSAHERFEIDASPPTRDTHNALEPTTDELPCAGGQVGRP